MKKRLLIALAATLVLSGAVTGGVIGVQHHQEKKAEQRAAAERRAEIRAAEREHQECVDATEDYLEAVSDVDSVVEVGVSFTDYSDLVLDAAKESKKVGEVTDDCQSDVVDELDEALSSYAEASSDWNDCIYDDFDCDVDDLDLSTTWFSAGLSVETARLGLKGEKGTDS